MKYLLITILLLAFAFPVYAVRFDWVLGQPAEVWEGADSTTSDAIWWVLGQPSVVASTTMGEGGEPPVEPAQELQPQVIIIFSLEDSLLKIYG